MERQPSNHQHANNPNDTKQVSRRSFLKMGLGALGTLATLELGGATFLFMKPRSLEGEFGDIVNAGPLDSFLPGSVVEFPDGRFFLIRSHEGGFLAVYQRCTHLGCSVSWEADKNHFFCPCHASSFDIHGTVVNPPAPRALDTFPIQIKDGQVFVDTTEAQTRDTFTPEQLTCA